MAFDSGCLGLPPCATVSAALLAAKNQLAVVAEYPLLEAEVLLSHVLQKPRSHLHAWSESSIDHAQFLQFSVCLQRRCNREPLAYITGRREFWSLDLMVTPDTLIPRPETELMVECVLESMPENNPLTRVADLGTGSGAIGLAIAHERPSWQIYATDASESALQIARKNAQQLGLDNVYFSCGNWCTALPRADFDVIVSNPPYIGESEWAAYAEGLEYEPRSALVSGSDGLDAIRTISHTAKYFLRPAGYVLVEHGFLQGAAVRRLFAASGYSQIHSVRDLSGRERVTIAQYHP
ncbi:Release factor glutamine methyltransferase [Aquicella siphonis]|uniref:Release factor glutamine methyltransferase n=1 Tax=Aquicella siphonis TaxID=254247 RepID=A0A5E4PJV3_9COXI|nr:peptide chain release factor N(5)-glutamine methyltransferase [Aquicella siphonis]VVC76693.1 Release factor glutamine methyltransferase [Aquicella siphonis]